MDRKKQYAKEKYKKKSHSRNSNKCTNPTTCDDENVNLSEPSNFGTQNPMPHTGSKSNKHNKHNQQVPYVRQSRHDGECERHSDGGNSQQYRKRKSRLKYPRYSESEDNQPSTSNNTQSSEQNESDIPGFYYDSVKKRYFKILENSTISHVVTKSSISKDKSEKKRLADIKKLDELKCRTTSLSNTHLLFKSRLGDVSDMFVKNTLLKQHTSNLKLVNSFPFFDNPVDGHERVEHTLKIIANPDYDRLLCLWSMKETIVQRLQLVRIREKLRESENQSLSLKMEAGGTTVLQSWNKITNVCWAPFQNFPEKSNILYTANCHFTGQASALIRNLDASTQNDVLFFDFNIGNHATWTCAWNPGMEKFSVGSEKTCLLIDVKTRKLWELNTLNSDPLAQTFSSTNLLYNGTKRGQIIAHDLRSSSTRPVRCMSHKSSIAHLVLSYDDSFMYASDFTGQLKVWDMRKNSVVMQYEGLYNVYKRIPFHIDESNTVIYGAGQDGYTRIWCLKTGKLLLNLPPPCPTSIDTIPTIQFSTRWANMPGNSGLLMGLGDKMYMYSS